MDIVVYWDAPLKVFIYLSLQFKIIKTCMVDLYFSYNNLPALSDSPASDVSNYIQNYLESLTREVCDSHMSLLSLSKTH